MENMSDVYWNGEFVSARSPCIFLLHGCTEEKNKTNIINNNNNTEEKITGTKTAYKKFTVCTHSHWMIQCLRCTEQPTNKQPLK